jgi:hypothetical protein
VHRRKLPIYYLNSSSKSRVWTPFIRNNDLCTKKKKKSRLKNTFRITIEKHICIHSHQFCYRYTCTLCNCFWRNACLSGYAFPYLFKLDSHQNLWKLHRVYFSTGPTCILNSWSTCTLGGNECSDRIDPTFFKSNLDDSFWLLQVITKTALCTGCW